MIIAPFNEKPSFLNKFSDYEVQIDQDHEGDKSYEPPAEHILLVKVLVPDCVAHKQLCAQDDAVVIEHLHIV